jgi:hypothetical protein
MAEPPPSLPLFGSPKLNPWYGCRDITFHNLILFLEVEPTTPQVVFADNPVYGFIERYNSAGDNTSKIYILKEVKNAVCLTRTDIHEMLQSIIVNGPLPIEVAVSYGDKFTA